MGKLVIDRFLAKVHMPPAWTACWPWAAHILPHGYGQFWLDGRMQQAHRVAYLLFIGPIPDGLDLDHLCRVRRCVSPLHLEAVTPQVNSLRGLTIAAANAAKTHCPSGHAYDEINTYHHPQGKRVCRACDRAAGRAHPQRRKVSA